MLGGKNGWWMKVGLGCKYCEKRWPSEVGRYVGVSGADVAFRKWVGSCVISGRGVAEVGIS